MRMVVQRASSGCVVVAGEVVGALPSPGLVVLMGVTHTDTPQIAAKMAAKLWALRVFDGVAGERWARSASDLGAPILLISQFTLYADTRKGRRPSWSDAAPGGVAEPLVGVVVETLQGLGAHVEQGVFGADMKVELVNDGPVTIVLDSAP
ncbi:MAG: D-aminoacyl-tRNA deacylase [Propionibacteriaceae bacterium]|nr:D-aminoacyl-tRNA deacylase [Propionibacteriaceae bacterium]